MARRGRKSNYEEMIEPEFESIAEKRKKGLSEKQIAEELGVSYSSWKEYKNKYPAFSALIKKSTQARNEAVIDSLNQLANGYYVYEEDTKILNHSKSYIDANGNRVDEKWQEATPIKRRRHIEKNVTACIFLSKNYMPEEYSDNPQKLEIDKERLDLEKQKLEKGKRRL